MRFLLERLLPVVALRQTEDKFLNGRALDLIQIKMSEIRIGAISKALVRFQRAGFQLALILLILQIFVGDLRKLDAALYELTRTPLFLK